MKTIPLTRGQFATVDDEDFEFLNQWKWHALPKDRSATGFYAHRFAYTPSGRKSVLMHRIILGIADTKTKGDHRDGDGLNNRKENLRIASSMENSRNQRKQVRKTSSIYKGVVFFKDGRQKPWRAFVQRSINGKKKQHYLGVFASEIDAAKAYDAKAKELFGEFANLNFPEKKGK